MDVWILNEDFHALEALLPAATGADRLALLLDIAWHARQRDTLLAQTLADEARSLCEDSNDGSVAAHSAIALVQYTPGALNLEAPTDHLL